MCLRIKKPPYEIDLSRGHAILPLLKEARKNYYGYVVRRKARVGLVSPLHDTGEIYEIGFTYSAMELNGYLFGYLFRETENSPDITVTRFKSKGD